MPFRPAHKVLIGLAIGLGLFQVVRLFVLVDRFTVDVPYWDQWTFYQAFFAPHTAWECFAWQHGPHRQGLGSLLTAAVNALTHWDQRAQCFVIAAVMLAAAATALLLKRRLFGHLAWTDAALVLLLLTPQQLAIYTQVPNVSHGALPLLLLLLTALAWTLRPPLARYAAVGLLSALAIFTGFGLFLGLVSPLLLAAECRVAWRAGRRRDLVAPLGVLVWLAGTWCLFLMNYRTAAVPPALANVSPPWTDYPVFVALQYGNLFGVRGTGWGARVVGFLAVGGLLALILHSLRQLLSGRAGTATDTTRTILMLALFALFFSTISSAGRVLLGLDGARACRYLPLLLPAAVALYLWLLGHAPARYVALFVLLIAVICLPWRERRDARRYFKGKTAWVAAYRATGDIDKADAWAKFPIFPPRGEEARRSLTEGLSWLQEHRGSFFRQPARAATAPADAREGGR